jgi:hypothetical protein
MEAEDRFQPPKFPHKFVLSCASASAPERGTPLIRNFLTYNQTEKELRPQFALYGGALGAGMMSSLWQPQDKLWKDGYDGVLTQAAFGMLSNWVGEFAPEIRRKLRP